MHHALLDAHSKFSVPNMNQWCRNQRSAWLAGTLALLASVPMTPIRVSAQPDDRPWSVRLQQEGASAATELLQFQPDASNEQAAALKPQLMQAARLMGQQSEWVLAISLLQRAYSLHRQCGGKPGDDFSLTADFAIASAATRTQNWQLAEQHAAAILQSAASESPYHAAAYPLVVQSRYRLSQWKAASEAIVQAVEDKHAAKSYAALAELAIAIGNGCLQAGDFQAGYDAYHAYSRLCPDGPQTKSAKLGIAWAAAMGATDSEAAAKLLMAYVKDYPQDNDAAHALQAASVAFDQAEQASAASAARLKLLQEYPQAEPSQQTLRRVLCLQCDEGSQPHRDAALNALRVCDQDGSLTTSLLNSFNDETQAAASEQLAVELIRTISRSGATDGASEAACHWAGEHQKWTLLAFEAAELGPPTEQSHRSIAIDRLLAESLVQTNRAQESAAWWDWLAEQHDPTDRLTLVRAAETAVTYREAAVAQQRVELLMQQTAESTFERALAVILNAELLVRRARFDEARVQLNSLVRDENAGRPLQPRAQWLIGETFFMQQRYSEAIDAYRQVDALDSSGQWTPLALLQAGKAFEKLGHPRDAAICYTALLGRFSDWPHATQAQARLPPSVPSLPRVSCVSRRSSWNCWEQPKYRESGKNCAAVWLGYGNQTDRPLLSNITAVTSMELPSMHSRRLIPSFLIGALVAGTSGVMLFSQQSDSPIGPPAERGAFQNDRANPPVDGGPGNFPRGEFPAGGFPGGFPGGGFPGGGPGSQPERELVDQFDTNKDGWLNDDERKPAREFVKANPTPRRGPGGRGRGMGPGGMGPGGMGPGGFGPPGFEPRDLTLRGIVLRVNHHGRIVPKVIDPKVIDPKAIGLGDLSSKTPLTIPIGLTPIGPVAIGLVSKDRVAACEAIVDLQPKVKRSASHPYSLRPVICTTLLYCGPSSSTSRLPTGKLSLKSFMAPTSMSSPH